MKFENLLHEIILENIELSEARPPMTQDEFIARAHAVHDTKRIEQGKKPYEYDKVNYVDNKTNVLITCPEKDDINGEHGDFPQGPKKHLQGHGCKYCSGKNKKTTDEFIKLAHDVHDTKRIEQGKKPYEYDKVNYVNNKTNVLITCPEKDDINGEHGDFPQTPNDHLKGKGCKYCSGKNKKTTDEFIRKAKKVHDEKRKINKKPPYNYSQVNYVDSTKDVIIICDVKHPNGKKHGPFLQTPNKHLQGQGCAICNELKGETDIRIILSKNNIKFTPQFQYEDCTSFKKSSQNKLCRLLSFDFFLPDYNTLIEYDGLYHFVKKRTNDEFMSQVLNDREKNSYTYFKNIKLIRISYIDSNNLEEEIRNGLLSKDQLYLSKSYGKHKTGWVNDKFQPTTKFLEKYNNVD
jgi:hypothetical protein